MPYLDLSKAAAHHKLPLPLSQQALLGLMHVLLHDMYVKQVVLHENADCTACCSWRGRYCERYRSTRLRKACRQFAPSPDAVVLHVKKGEVLP